MKEHYENIFEVEEFRQLSREKSRFSWFLAILIMMIYFSFILVIAFIPEFFAQPVFEGSVISIGIPIGLLVILSSFLLTGIYVYRANQYYDQKNRDLLQRYMKQRQVDL